MLLNHWSFSSFNQVLTVTRIQCRDYLLRALSSYRGDGNFDPKLLAGLADTLDELLNVGRKFWRISDCPGANVDRSQNLASHCMLPPVTLWTCRLWLAPDYKKIKNLIISGKIKSFGCRNCPKVTWCCWAPSFSGITFRLSARWIQRKLSYFARGRRLTSYYVRIQPN